MVRDMCYLLAELGIAIDGIGSSRLTIHRVSKIQKLDATYTIAEDPIETMTFIAAAVTTISSIIV